MSLRVDSVPNYSFNGVTQPNPQYVNFQAKPNVLENSPQNDVVEKKKLSDLTYEEAEDFINPKEV